MNKNISDVYYTPSIEDIKQSLIISNDIDLFEKVELSSLTGLKLIEKIKQLCKKNTIRQK